MFIYIDQTFNNTIKPEILDSDKFEGQTAIHYMDRCPTAHESLEKFIKTCINYSDGSPNILRMSAVGAIIRNTDKKHISNFVDLWWFKKNPEVLYAVDINSSMKGCGDSKTGTLKIPKKNSSYSFATFDTNTKVVKMS